MVNFVKVLGDDTDNHVHADEEHHADVTREKDARDGGAGDLQGVVVKVAQREPQQRGERRQKVVKVHQHEPERHGGEEGKAGHQDDEADDEGDEVRGGTEQRQPQGVHLFGDGQKLEHLQAVRTKTKVR